MKTKKVKITLCNIVGALLLLFQITYCTPRNRNEHLYTFVQGNVKGLPDGMLILLGTNSLSLNEPLDSVHSVKGQFSFKIEKKKLPAFLTIQLQQDNGVKLFFTFETNKKYRGEPLNLQNFMRDDTILINGNLKYKTPKDAFFSLNKMEFASIDRPIIAGRQTYVYYNVDLNLEQVITDSIEKKLSDTIKKYNYSYYLLEELNKHRNKFSKLQLNNLLSKFDNNLQNDQIAIELKNSLKLRKERQIYNTDFINRNGNTQKINIKDSKLNMIIIWASWCGPCRAEVPVLKKIYRHYSENKNVNIVSISIDSNTEDWKKAVIEENMPWEQFFLPPSLQPYIKEIFEFDGSIPTTIFVDSTGSVINKTVGYDTNQYAEYEKIITSNTN